MPPQSRIALHCWSLHGTSATFTLVACCLLIRRQQAPLLGSGWSGVRDGIRLCVSWRRARLTSSQTQADGEREGGNTHHTKCHEHPGVESGVGGGGGRRRAAGTKGSDAGSEDLIRYVHTECLGDGWDGSDSYVEFLSGGRASCGFWMR